MNELQSFIENSPWRQELEPVTETPIATGDSLEPAQIVEKLLNSQAAAVLQRSASEWNQSEWNDLILHLNLVKNPHSILSHSSKVLGPESTHFLINHHSTSEKKETKSKLESMFTTLGSQHLNESLEAIFEELFMNATLDAPSEARKLGLIFDPTDFEVKFIFSFNDHRVFLGCSDPFGSLSLKKAIGRMSEVYTKGAGLAINRGEGGAGLGCTILFEHALSLIMLCQKAQQTFVGCLLPRGMSYRQRSRMKKSIVCFEVEGD